MKIIISKIGLNPNEVFFVTEFGEGKGSWYGPQVEPGAECEVEFELTELFMRWVDIVPSDSDQYHIRLDRDTISFVGILDNLEEDGTGYLRVGDSLIMFESLGEPMRLGVYVELKTKALKIYPLVF